MLLDYNSLLLAVGFSAACLSLTLFGTWLTARSDKFLLTWAISVLVVVADESLPQAIGPGPVTSAVCPSNRPLM